MDKKEKIDFIIKSSEKLGITSNQFGDNTDISSMTAYNILNRKSDNPRMHNLDTMIRYIESKTKSSAKKDHPNYQETVAKGGDIVDFVSPYKTNDKKELLRIALEFAENYESLKNHKIVKNVIEVEVLKQLIKEREAHRN